MRRRREGSAGLQVRKNLIPWASSLDVLVERFETASQFRFDFRRDRGSLVVGAGVRVANRAHEVRLRLPGRSNQAVAIPRGRPLRRNRGCVINL